MYVTPTAAGNAFTAFGWYGRWSPFAPGYTVTHEIGHFFGLPDDYSHSTGNPNEGHAGHMMGQDRGMVDQHEIEDILRKLPCKCE